MPVSDLLYVAVEFKKNKTKLNPRATLWLITVWCQSRVGKDKKLSHFQLFTEIRLNKMALRFMLFIGLGVIEHDGW